MKTVDNMARKGLQRMYLSANTEFCADDELRVLLKPFGAILCAVGCIFICPFKQSIN